MSTTKQNASNPFESAFDAPKDDWEDWEEEEEGAAGAHSAITDDTLLIDLSDDTTEKPAPTSVKRNSVRNIQSRHSVQKPLRLKSRLRQKAQNDKAGIKLVTDMSKFRKVAQQLKSPDGGAYEDDKNAGRFVDEDALKALEGSPTEASVGSFHWLKRKPGNTRTKSVKKPARGPESDLSPDSRPIVIGIAVPSDHLSDHQVSPQTAMLETPLDSQKYPQQTMSKKPPGFVQTPEQQRSVWSPDTEDNLSTYGEHRPASSIYSQPSLYGGNASPGDVPPVPTLPATMKFKNSKLAAQVESDDEDSGTPCTLFEEDGSPVAPRALKPKAAPTSPVHNATASGATSGWWDHVTRPLSQQSTNPFKQQPQQPSSSSPPAPQEWWKGVDEKKPLSSRASGLTVMTAIVPQLTFVQTSIASHATASSTQLNNSSGQPETHSEKARILLEENQTAVDEPPPYSPPKMISQVKYGAILPQSYSVNTAPIPSPGPISPGISGTMTSQGAIDMSDIPLTPRVVPAAVLPDRPVGSYVPGDHFQEAAGTRLKTERRRRRHEKEDVAARKVGGFWRGRGIMPQNGCFGRTGREGRKRRRVCLGIFAGILAAIILIVVLVVVLTRRSSPQAPEHNIWLNLTDFPPMPTGVLTVSGPDNTESVPGCVKEGTAQTAWSCSIPKDQQVQGYPFSPDQPEFIFQIQYDNSTRELWKLPGGRGDGGDGGFLPNPTPPSIDEMNFLGNTTDGIVSNEKEGEPTPFYMSVLHSIEDTVGPDMVMRREVNSGLNNGNKNGSFDFNLTSILPPPDLNPDGTGAPGKLYPFVSQQPVRLFDRGLPTEHYGFYTHFNKTVYVFDKDEVNPADKDGGSSLEDAKYIMTWTQTRFLVKIWTRKENTTQLLGDGPIKDTDDASAVHTQPGTMPYPVTIAEDLHGGDPNAKATFYYGVTDQQRINTTDTKLFIISKKFGGTLINPTGSGADLSLGGIDGGTGGCKCGWENFRDKTVAGAEKRAPTEWYS